MRKLAIVLWAACVVALAFSAVADEKVENFQGEKGA